MTAPAPLAPGPRPSPPPSVPVVLRFSGPRVYLEAPGLPTLEAERWEYGWTIRPPWKLLEWSPRDDLIEALRDVLPHLDRASGGALRGWATWVPFPAAPSTARSCPAPSA